MGITVAERGMLGLGMGERRQAHSFNPVRFPDHQLPRQFREQAPSSSLLTDLAIQYGDIEPVSAPPTATTDAGHVSLAPTDTDAFLFLGARLLRPQDTAHPQSQISMISMEGSTRYRVIIAQLDGTNRDGHFPSLT